MQVDIKTASVKPIRNTFAHLERRFGDKPASRYQEATCDLQSEVNFHYKPLWDPTREMYDKARTAIAMSDWYDLKDPRQFYYGTYTMTRARWQDGADRQMHFIEQGGLLQGLPQDLHDRIVAALVTLRHYEWGANTNNAHISAYGWGAAITQAAMMNTMDRLAMAQHLSRIGLLLDGAIGTSLPAAKREWLEADAWQGLRREIENMFVTRDWFELLVAQNLVADALIYPLFFGHIDAELSAQGAHSIRLATELLTRWQDENVRWVDAVIKAAARDSDANQVLLAGWTAKWREALVGACRPLAERFLGSDAADSFGNVVAALDARIVRLGLETGT